MENVGSLVGVDSPQLADASNSRDESVRRCIQSLEHSCACRDANCRIPKCHKWKKALQHMKLCKQRRQTPGSCRECKHLIVLCRYHTKHCDLNECLVPFCWNTRRKLQERERLLGLLREKCDAARASCGHPGVHWICWDCYEPCCETPECECSVDVHNDRTQHAIHFNGSSAFCGQCGLPIEFK
ncbi:TAZ zinc finger family protein [Aphelenchoides avenae]|nr:TAZ zinc finger family protein [Aphelenchus avenae]